ncbi:hypothetical protein HMPREF0731_0922 [Pseudoroseomonas cervicalis ATCC 49957]|uniref:Uncharacterized protein n=1 Tax=Pseudoroseomonas cervicalis ATCC 49957 TaxID=525371 RepID=D5RIL2_9PROT|nr:hypothetical protein HMPREF0731_0922 [Pseudoroseomonas cervicalis ATCC 49957]
MTLFLSPGIPIASPGELRPVPRPPFPIRPALPRSAGRCRMGRAPAAPARRRACPSIPAG